MKNYKELIIWQEATAPVKKVYGLAKQFPFEGKCGVIAQVTRASVSVAANIAAGSTRNNYKYYAEFLQITLNAVFKRQIYLVIDNEMNLAKAQAIGEVGAIPGEKIKMIHTFLKRLAATANS